MNQELNNLLIQYRKQLNFNPKEWIEIKIQRLNEYMEINNLNGIVIGLSGGVDSAVSFMIANLAKQQKNSPIKIVLPVLMPYHPFKGKETTSRALKQCEYANVNPFFCPIGGITNTMSINMGKSMSDWLSRQHNINGVKSLPSRFAKGQLQSYIRTPHLYFATQLLSDNGFRSIVLGTGNADEDGYLAYYCKAGDGVVDIQLINDLHKSQVFEVAKECNVIDDIINAKPSADLWEDQSDEDELGFSYDFVELYTGYYLKLTDNEKKNMLVNLTENSRKEFKLMESKCVAVHFRNKHKLNGIINL